MRTHKGYFYSGSMGETDCFSLMKGRVTEVIFNMGDGSRAENWLRFTFEPRPSSPSLIYRGSPLTPIPSWVHVIDDHQCADTAQYFNFLPGQRNFRGWVKFRSTVWCLQLTTSPSLMSKTWDPNIQLRIFKKPGPLCVNKTFPAGIVLPDSSSEDSLCECSITQFICLRSELWVFRVQTGLYLTLICCEIPCWYDRLQRLLDKEQLSM